MLFWVCPHRGSVCAPQKPAAEAGPCPPKHIPLRPRGMLSCRGCSPCPSRLPVGGSSKQAASFPCSVLPSGVFRRRYQKEIIWRKKKKSFPTSPAAWHITRVSTGCLRCCGSTSIPSQRLKKQKDFRTSPRVLGLACTEHWSPSLGWIYTE